MLRASGLAFALLCSPAAAQTGSAEQAVREADAAFWRAFNACDAAAMAPFFAEDVEFYHDITGLTRTRAAVVESLAKGPCGTPGLHMRRELAADSVRFEPVPGYGAILSGEHLFYARQDDGPERLATRARFVVIWHLDGGRWRMTRVISDAHEPVAYRPPAPGLTIPQEVLRRYVGHYRTDAGDLDVTLESGTLVVRSGNLRVTLAASAPGRFFALERDLRFTFDAAGIAIEENGRTVARGPRAAP